MRCWQNVVPRGERGVRRIRPLRVAEREGAVAEPECLRNAVLAHMQFVYHGSVKVAVPQEERKPMTPNQVKTFAAAIDMSRSDEVSARLEEFDALVSNWLVDNSNSIN